MTISKWLFGPAIKGYYVNGSKVLYESSTLESLCESTIGWIRTGFSVFVVFAPWYYGYQPIGVGFTNVQQRYIELAESHGKCLIMVGGLYLLLCLLRSSSRVSNPVYQRYVATFSDSKLAQADLLVEKRKWDIGDYSAWGVDFVSRPEKPLSIIEGKGCGLAAPICQAIGHSFARWMIYPGATPLLNMALRPTLVHERSQLLLQGAKRAKLETSKGDQIDTLFSDKRGKSQNGEILFITSEGNAGFMEVGSYTSVQQSAYSTLGWNHPGFGDSTGSPYPARDGAAIVAVIDYAIKELGFKENQIVLYGWSIGGFSVVYGASYYSNLRGVYLDATFDDVLPLAEHVMPPAILPITTRTIRNIWNLHVSEYLKSFDGAVTILRRNRDEIMQKNPANSGENRANFLLLSFLEQRYPGLMTKQNREVLWSGLKLTSSRAYRQWLEQKGDREMAKSVLESLNKGNKRPEDLGQGLDDDLKQALLLYLVEKHFVTFDATHGTPLPVELVHAPWKQ